MVLFFAASKHAFSCDSVNYSDSLNGRTFLFEITNNQQDIVVTIQDQNDNQESYISPLGRFGKQYILLTPEDVNGPFSLCIENKNGQTNTQSTIQSTDMSQAPQELINVLSLMTDASKKWMLQEHSSALASWKQATSIYLAESFLTYRTYAYLVYVSANIHQFDYQNAEAALNELVQLQTFSPDTQYKINWLRAQILVRKNQNKKAISALREALVIMPSQFLPDAADIRSLLATALIQSGELDEAQIELEQSLENSNTDGVQLARTLDTLGFLFIEKAKQAVEPLRALYFNQALDYEHDALEALNNISLPTTNNNLLTWQQAYRNDVLRSKARVHNNIGTIYERIGEVKLAHFHYKSGLEFAELSGFEEAKAFFNKNVGMMYQYLGDFESAKQFQSVSIELFEDSAPNWYAIVNCQLGKSQQALSLWNEALSSFQVCFNFFSNPEQDQNQTQEKIHESSRYMVLSQYLIAQIHIEQGQFEMAQAAISKVEHLIDQVDDPDLLVTVSLIDAQLLAITGDNQGALKSAQTAIQKAKDSRYPSVDMEAFLVASEMAEKLGNTELVQQYLNAGIKIAQSLYTHLDPELLAPIWTGKAQDLFDKQNAILLKQPLSDFSDLANLFANLERARGVSYRIKNQSDYTANKERAAKRLNKIAALSDQKVRSEGKQSQQIATDISYQKFLLNSVNTSGNKLNQATTLENVQTSLNPDDVVLFYTFIEERLYALSITKSHVEWHKLGEKQRVFDQLSALRDAVTDPNEAYRDIIKQFSDLVLPEGNYWQTSKSIFVIPHKALSTLPFAALTRTEQYNPLALNYDIVIVPSLSRLVGQQEVGNRSELGHQAMALFFDPEFSTQAGETNELHGDTWTSQINHLVFSREEGESIIEQMEATSMMAFSGQQATKVNLLSEQSRNASILHISTHGHFDKQDPANVGLAVSPESGSDRYVTKFDIHSHSFSNQLVVLSGCDTNRGKLLAGEGPQSLARTFLMSGAQNVISTLWPVSDRASSIFMEKFYQHLANGKTINDALASAQADMLKNFRFRHPFYWAAYTLQSTSHSAMDFKH